MRPSHFTFFRHLSDVYRDHDEDMLCIPVLVLNWSNFDIYVLSKRIDDNENIQLFRRRSVGFRTSQYFYLILVLTKLTLLVLNVSVLLILDFTLGIVSQLR